MLRVVLADLQGRDGYVNKDTVAGGYGSRFKGSSWTTRLVERLKKIYQNLPSIQVGYLAALVAQAGQKVVMTREPLVEGDVALVLTSMVDYRHEIEWAARAKKEKGMRVGFFGTFATHVPQAFLDHGDFVIRGEPEQAVMALAGGAELRGVVDSPFIKDLDSLPFPRWDLVNPPRFGHITGRSVRPARAAFPLLSSRSCPEFCTYCPHRITSEYRTRSGENVVAELEEITRRYGRSYIIFRDPLFTEDRERTFAICEGILRKSLPVLFECETRFDNLDAELIDLLHRAGLRTVSFGVESVEPTTLRRVARRPIPPEHQRRMINYCHGKGIMTQGFYVFGFLPDTEESIRATIDYAIDLGTTIAGFKILTPYPGTPLYKQMRHLVFESDWERFDGYTPTFHHPHLSSEQLTFLLKSAYARFYIRPSWLWNYLGLKGRSQSLIDWADRLVRQKHDRTEAELMARRAF